MEAQDLNFVLFLKIFIHFNGQLQASHLILGYTPLYTSYQTPRPAFLVSNPLLTYIDVCIPGFLPNISMSEAWRRGPHRAKEGSRELVRDSSSDSVFHG